MTKKSLTPTHSHQRWWKRKGKELGCCSADRNLRWNLTWSAYEAGWDAAKAQLLRANHRRLRR